MTAVGVNNSIKTHVAQENQPGWIKSSHAKSSSLNCATCGAHQKEERGLLNGESRCQLRRMAFVKTPFFFCFKMTEQIVMLNSQSSDVTRFRTSQWQQKLTASRSNAGVPL
jgi:hypothetical protein